MGEWAGKVVLISGAGKGIGRALAEAFAKRGTIVAAHDLTPINLDETVSRIQNVGGRGKAYVANIASKLDLQTMLNAILDEHQRIDYLINTLSVSPRDTLLQIDEWGWRRTIDLNLTGPFLLMQSVGRVMQAQGGGAIVNLVSMELNSPVAPAGKSGLIGLTRSAASEYQAYNIRVNAVCYGLPEAEQIADLPDDPVELTLALCSQKTEMVTGRVIQSEPWQE
jgi:NAD(P)-dependent dehydrogenase (short-subunit alcohol dehydrogenase family)